MRHDAYVRLVDTHAKRIGSYHDTYPVMLPVTLPLVLYRMLQSCMIEGGTESCLRQQLRYLTGMPATADIDDGSTFLTIQQLYQLRPFVHGMTHEVGEVLTLEGHAEDVEGVGSGEG